MPVQLPRSAHARPTRGSSTTTTSNASSGLLPPVGTSNHVRLRKRPAGSSLRVGKIITDARALASPLSASPRNDNNAAESGVRASSFSASVASRFIDEGEQRVQHEIIDMLTAKLAKKEKEYELLRHRHGSFDDLETQYNTQMAQLQSELLVTRDEMMTKCEKLQSDAQHAQLQADHFRNEGEEQRVTLHELRRQRERDSELARGKEQHTQRQLDDLRRELAMTVTERRSLESNVGLLQEHLNVGANHTRDALKRCDALETAVAQGHEQILELREQLGQCRAQAADAEDTCARLEQEKQTLEDKVQQLTRSLRDAHARASDAERRKSDLTQAESQLSKQLTQLHRENEELKARNGQLLAQTKQQQTRVAALENGKTTLETKQKDASEEIEQAKKRCREYQFRIKQLQEEVLFLTKKKPVTATTASAPATLPIASDERTDSDGMPSWMRD